MSNVDREPRLPPRLPPIGPHAEIPPTANGVINLTTWEHQPNLPAPPIADYGSYRIESVANPQQEIGRLVSFPAGYGGAGFPNAGQDGWGWYGAAWNEPFYLVPVPGFTTPLPAGATALWFYNSTFQPTAPIPAAVATDEVWEIAVVQGLTWTAIGHMVRKASALRWVARTTRVVNGLLPAGGGFRFTLAPALPTWAGTVWSQAIDPKV
jgi:hypothetical protein